ncbi:centromere-associated protein E isoform X1 [Cucumis melo var. makuwa]|uniref:Centromere-associated protein E isoform X1 n=1 Tax=Cucumis melo var. makuwa TaxID=1194695 RepID=A0A5A7VIR7_CUCMM|nr:centromere-associated protein E isoform X1 [Cucumis melo var. makuwa]
MKDVRQYPSFYAMLKAESLDNVLPGVKTLTDGVQVYRKFYSEEKELSNGVLGIHVKKSVVQPYIILSNVFNCRFMKQGIYVAGLREEIVASSEQVLDLMEFGESHRHIGETNMNLYSSRFHTIFRMIIESRDKVEDGEAGNSCDVVRISVMKMDPSSTHVG